MTATLRCLDCGERMPLAVQSGDVAEFNFEHAPRCAFLAAIERGRGREWVEMHGNPMSVEHGVSAG